jgi:hypothetical protein
MCTEPGHERPTARANLKIVLKPVIDLQGEIEVPASESRGLLNIPHRALNIVGPALILLVASYVGLPGWAAVLLAAGQMIVNGVGHYLDVRRAAGLAPSPRLRRTQRSLSQRRPKALN